MGAEAVCTVMLYSAAGLGLVPNPIPCLQALVYFTLWLQLLGFSDPQVGLRAARRTPTFALAQGTEREHDKRSLSVKDNKVLPVCSAGATFPAHPTNAWLYIGFINCNPVLLDLARWAPQLRQQAGRQACAHH